MPVIHESYAGRTELRTARKPYRCEHHRESSLIDPDGLSLCGHAILAGDRYVLETSMPWSDCGPYFRIERTQQPVIRNGVFLYSREVTKRIRTVRTVRLCLLCALRESHAYRCHVDSAAL